jgi:hypothetical protein
MEPGIDFSHRKRATKAWFIYYKFGVCHALAQGLEPGDPVGLEGRKSVNQNLARAAGAANKSIWNQKMGSQSNVLL